MKTVRQANVQKGLTLLELLISLSILGGIVAGITSLVQTAGDDARASVTALHTRTVGEATSAYIKDNYASITSIATDTTPVLIRVADLVSTGYLPAGYATTNPRLQATCALVLEPTPNQLTGLVVTEGGDTIDDLTLGQVASLIGGAGGGIYSTAPTTVRGAMGGYSFAVGAYGNPNSLGQRCDGTAGNIVVAAGHPVMALWYADGAQASSTLYRDAVPGNPALNTMNTPILMGPGSQQTAGAACTTSGAIASSATGAVLTCEGGTWKPGGSAYWQDPVATFASLPTCNAAAKNQTRVVETPSVGAGRRAYTCDGAGTWNPLAVNDAGNLVVAGTATIKSLSGDLEISTTANEGASCSPNGRIAKRSEGLMLSCQNGVWRTQDFCPLWTGDLNSLQSTGCYNGAGLGNAPSADWYFIEVKRHYNTGNYYTIQRATIMTGSSAARTFTRSQQSSTSGVGWGAWLELTNTASAATARLGGNEACGANSQSIATCPAGMKLDHGGWTMTQWLFGSKNSPDASFPLSDTQWLTANNGEGKMCIMSVIVCRWP